MATDFLDEDEDAEQTEILEEIIVPESKNIINTLNENCIVYIFEYLEWCDLLSIADSCKPFYMTVHNVFKRKYSKSNVRLGENTYPR